MNWITKLLPLVSHGGTALLAWVLHGASNEGTVTPGGATGIAALSVATFFAFWQSLKSKYEAAGGKLDGHVSDAEAKAIIDAAGEALKLPDPTIKAAEALSGSAAALANGLIAWMTKGFADNKPPNQSQPDKVALLMQAQQAIAWELASDDDGAKAAAKVLERLHQVWNPATATKPATIPIG